MKWVIYSDIHHGRGFSYGRVLENGINTRLVQSVKIEKYIGEIVKGLLEKGEKVVVVFLGDLVERAIFAHINDFVYEEIEKRLGLCLNIFVRGNHDKYMKGYDVYGDVFNRLKRKEDVLVVFEKKALKIDGKEVLFLPWGSGLDSKEKVVDLVFGHIEVEGSDVYSGYKLNSGVKGMLFDGSWYRYGFLGHIHKFQKVGKRCVYVGSVMALDMSELEDDMKGIYIYDDESDELYLEELEGVVSLMKKFVVKDESELEQALLRGKGNLVIVEVLERNLYNYVIKRRLDLLEQYLLENLVVVDRSLVKRDNVEVGSVSVGMRNKSFEEKVELFVKSLSDEELKGLDRERLIMLGKEFLK